jgi:hypothetical protein
MFVLGSLPCIFSPFFPSASRASGHLSSSFPFLAPPCLCREARTPIPRYPRLPPLFLPRRAPPLGSPDPLASVRRLPPLFVPPPLPGRCFYASWIRTPRTLAGTRSMALPSNCSIAQLLNRPVCSIAQLLNRTIPSLHISLPCTCFH